MKNFNFMLCIWLAASLFLLGCSDDSLQTIDAGNDAGFDAGSDAGSDPGADPGRDPGADPGSDPGADPGSDPGADSGSDAGSDGGADQASDPGADSGGDQGQLYVVEPAEDFDDPLLKISMYFSPVDSTEQIVLDELAKVEVSVHMAFFNIRLQEIADELVSLHQAGKDVKILMDQKQMDKVYNTLDDWMIEQGLDVSGVLNENATDATMHNKFTIIDGSRLLTGSLNYSTTAFNSSEEDLTIIEDADIAALYEEEFLELAAFGEAVRVEDPGAALQVYFGPEDRLDTMTIAAIDSAQADLNVMMFSAGLGAIEDALVAAVGRGVNVVFLIDDYQAGNTDLDENIETAGAHVIRVDRSFPVELHHKLCVVDDDLVLLGSFNWTPLASFYNDENYVRAVSAALATRVLGRLTDIVVQEDASFDPSSYGWSSGPRTVTFKVTNLQVSQDGDCYVIGDHASLGGMDASQAVIMSRADGPLGETWSLSVDLPAGTNVDYKYLIKGPDGIAHREDADPRSLTVPYTPGPHIYYDTFRE
jgi:phosphatidylserine/phosphatidylglycerophosphate/cardiolipin synthase-like enzyme